MLLSFKETLGYSYYTTVAAIETVYGQVIINPKQKERFFM